MTGNDKTPAARKPRGFADKTAARIALERRIADEVSDVYRRWGFDALDTGPCEYADAIGTFLPDSDRPNAGVFSLRDDDNQWLSLRYDHTAPLARYVAQNRERLVMPFRRYCCGPVWRNEKPGPFRYREFIQCDADTIGAGGPLADAQMVAMACEALSALGIEAGGFSVRVNTRRLLDAVLEKGDVPASALDGVLRALDKRDRLGDKGVADLLGQGRRDPSGDVTAGCGLAPPAIDLCLAFASAGSGESRSRTLAKLDEMLGMYEAGRAGIDELRVIDSILSAQGLDDSMACFDTSIVRGLAYYTGPVFEAQMHRAGSKSDSGAIGGGGRYDGLVARFGGAPVPATGFSLGVSRLAALLAEDDGASGPVVILVMEQAMAGDYCAMAAELRAMGVRAEVYQGASGMRAQMKYADRRKAPAVVIVGEDERKSGMITIKDLRAGARAAAAIADNASWRQERPGQFSVGREDMVTAVRACLDERDG